MKTGFAGATGGSGPSAGVRALGAALAAVATTVEPVAPATWSFAIASATGLAGRAHIDDGWLVLQAALPSAARPVAPWRLLEWNATLPAGGRFALAPGGTGVDVRAEVVLDDDVDVGRRVRDAGAAFAVAATRWGGGPEPGCGPPADRRADDIGSELGELCRRSGWNARERGPDRVAVDLDVPGAFLQAVVEARPDATLAATVPVLDPGVRDAGPACGACRRALALLLARLCGVVRMARAASGPPDGSTDVRFEVVLGGRPAAAELAHAFAALSVACRLGVREAAVLWRDRAVARTYLQRWDDAVARRATRT